jgi:type IV secretion system protein TrbB
VGTVSLKSEAASRSVRMLRTAMGATITGWLEDPAIVEIMLDPDGRLWIDRLAGGLADSAERLSAADGERSVRLWPTASKQQCTLRRRGSRPS